MTQEQYDEAYLALTGRPERHLVINGRQPHSVRELNELAEAHGLRLVVYGEQVPASEAVEEPEVIRSSPPVIPPVVTPVKEPEKRTPPPPRAPVKATPPAVPPAVPPLGSGPQRSAATPPIAAEDAVRVLDDSQSAGTPESTPDVLDDDKDGEEKPRQDPPSQVVLDGPAMTEDVGPMPYRRMQAVAKELGINPIPRTQADLVGAIESKRAEIRGSQAI